MRLIRSLNSISGIARRTRKAGKSIGFVPTMGAFHQGHISLIRKARKENDVVITSIFVNPAQFGPNEDYRKYPRSVNRDKQEAAKAGSDILFFPKASSIYPKGHKTHVEVERLSDIMCGKSRPGHFRGVATVCTKLFNIVMPDTVYLGQKDFQQAVIIRDMVKDLNMNLKVKTAPIVREPSGLAMSSRNIYLTPAQKDRAALLYESLKRAEQMIKGGARNASKIKSAVSRFLNRPGIKLEYLMVVSPADLSERSVINEDVLIALAAKIGKARLIDNIVVKLKN